MDQRMILAKKFVAWLFAAIGAAIVASLIADFWTLIKAGALFDALEAVSGEVQEANFIRTDLVDSVKQSVAQWILSLSCIIAAIFMFVTKSKHENWLDPFIFGIGYGFTLGLGILFLLSNFDRFKDIHLAVGKAQYGLAGVAIISTIIISFVRRYRDRIDEKAQRKFP